MMPFFVLAGFGGYASLSAIGLGAEQGISSAWSPGGEYRASLWAVHTGGVCERASLEVRVERRWGPLKTGEVVPFCFVGTASQVQVRWVGPSDLSITCHACNQDSILIDRTNWGKLHYRYDVMGQ